MRQTRPATEIRAQLDKLGPEPTPFLDVAGPGGRIRLYHVARAGQSITCQKIEMVLRPLPGVTECPEILCRRLERWAQKVSALLTPLRILEFEPRETRALLRSHPSKRNSDGSVAYHELWWHASDQALEGTWSRWGWKPEGRRYTVPIKLPRNVLLRVIRVTLNPATWHRAEPPGTRA